MSGDLDLARATVKQFMQRAERVMNTPAAQREDLATIGTTIGVLIRVGQAQQEINRAHLPTGELHEVANALRPMFLQKEALHVTRVLNQIHVLVRGSEADEPVKQWKKALPKALAAERWTLAVADPIERETTRLTNVQIAELWFNAHVWHDDNDKQYQLRHIPEDECLICATVWVSDRVAVVRAIQQGVIDLRTAGIL